MMPVEIEKDDDKDEHEKGEKHDKHSQNSLILPYVQDKVGSGIYAYKSRTGRNEENTEKAKCMNASLTPFS
ncbi:MAG: hypothetical protein M1510_13540 [Nitrospirae bacterium]|nr:hypothetical protein [Nitrospirota bacterium]